MLPGALLPCAFLQGGAVELLEQPYLPGGDTAGPCFVEEVGGLREEFLLDTHVIGFTSDTLADKVAHYKANYSKAERIGRSGREWVFSRHTYRHRLLTMLDLMK